MQVAALGRLPWREAAMLEALVERVVLTYSRGGMVVGFRSKE